MKLASLYRQAAQNGLVHPPDRNALQRARRAYKKNLANPGDCNGNELLLAALAIAQADIGIGPGWIPEVQRIGVKIARLGGKCLRANRVVPVMGSIYCGCPVCDPN